MNLLTRAAFLKGSTLRQEKVELSEGIVWVREMSSKEKDIHERSLMKEKPNADPNVPSEFIVNLEDFHAKLAVVTVCDESGKLLFKPEDAKILNSKLRASDMEKITEVATRLNVISQKDKDKVVKNS